MKSDKYLVEVRLSGYAKKFTKELIWDISKRFHVKGVTRRRPVPHLTIAGTFTTNTKNIWNVVRAVEEVCKNYDIAPYRMYKYSYLTDSKGKKVIYIDVEPSKALDELRWKLAKKLDSIIDLKSFQRNKSFKFHITIAFKDIDRKFDRIWKYLQNKEKPNIHSHALRITILKNSRILREYDLLQKKMLNRSEAKSKKIYQQTINILKNSNNFYQNGIINKIKNIFSKKNVFITSDHHFYHKNIIKYCNRPYSSVFEMNEDMIYRWNEVVSKNDRVYHLGDLALAGKKDEYFKKIKNLRTRLNGEIFIIIGNHDEKGGRPELLRKAGFKVWNKEYIIIKNLILSHRPLENISNGYVNVHGHIHDKKTSGKRINASVDVTGFEPKSIKKYFEEADRILKN